MTYALGIDVSDRFWAKVDKSGDCWLWTASGTRNGYGKVGIAGRTLCAHRVAYELVIGPIPAGLDLDHLCRNRRCVNPAHLEPVTRRVNIKRGAQGSVTECVHGHPFDDANTWIDKRGRRYCRACNRANSRRIHAARRAAA